jgi:hypothetical protein
MSQAKSTRASDSPRAKPRPIVAASGNGPTPAKSSSLWRRAASTPGLAAGLKRVAEQIAKGETVPLHDLYRSERRSRP